MRLGDFRKANLKKKNPVSVSGWSTTIDCYTFCSPDIGKYNDLHITMITDKLCAHLITPDTSGDVGQHAIRNDIETVGDACP